MEARMKERLDGNEDVVRIAQSIIDTMVCL